MSERPEAFIELLPPDVGHNLRHFGPETHHLTGEECHCSPEQVPHEAVAARPATLAASEASRVVGEGSDAAGAREALSEVEHLRRAHWEMTQEAARLRAQWTDGHESHQWWRRQAYGETAKRESAERARDAALAEVEHLEAVRSESEQCLMALRDRLAKVEALPAQWRRCLEALGSGRAPGTVNARSFVEQAVADLARALAVAGDTEDASPAASPAEQATEGGAK